MTSRQKFLPKRTAMRQVFRRLMSGEEGGAIVEATIIVPILVAMGVYAADFGLLFYNKIEVQNAAQAGAQWAIANRPYNSYNPTAIQAAGQSATSLSGVTVTPSEFCGCSTDSSGNPVVTQLASGACTGTTNVVQSACPSGHGVVGNYVTVTAAYAYTSFVPTRLIASTPTNSATATARIQ
jgi:Flp pilus assembly protein TadG